MKRVLIALLLVVVVLFVAAEAKRGGGRGGGRGRPGGRRPWQKKFKGLECPKNCSDCDEGRCRACDDDFVLKTLTFRRFNKTICLPCGRQLKMKNPALFLQQCAECPRNCTSCENGSCQRCDDGFFAVETRLLKRTICVPCGPRLKKNWPDVFVKECSQNGCGRGCANCTMPGLCTECEEDLKLFTPPGSNITKCIRNCPPFYKKSSSPARCDFRQPRKPNSTCGKTCEECTEAGVCTKCIDPLVLIKLGNRSTCRKKCPFPFKKYFDPETKTKICEKPDKKLRKGGRKNVSDLP